MQEETESVKYDEEVVYSVGKDEVVYADLTSDLMPVAMIKEKQKSEYSPKSVYFLYNDKYLGPFDEMEEITAAGDDSKFLFVASKNGIMSIYCGDEIIVENCGSIDDLIFSDDKKKYAYVSDQKEDNFVFVDGERSYGPFDSIERLFFPSYDKLYFFAKKDHVWDLYINGQAQNLNCESVTYFLPVGGEKYSQEAFFCIEKNQKWYVFFTDGRNAGPFDAMSFHIRHGEKTGDFAYVAINNGTNYIYRNNKKIASTSHFVDYINFSEDEENLIYVIKEDKGQFIYVDKTLVAGPVARIGFATILSHDKKAIYYSSFKDGIWNIGHTYLDDKDRVFHKDLMVPYKCNEIFLLGILKEGSRIFYTTSSSDSLDDIQYFYLQGFGSLGPFTLVESIETSPDGKSFAFIAYSGQNWYIYLNGKAVAGPFYKAMNCKFSENSQMLRFIAVPFEVPKKMVRMVCIDGKAYIGHFDTKNTTAIYWKEGKLIKRTFKE